MTPVRFRSDDEFLKMVCFSSKMLYTSKTKSYLAILIYVQLTDGSNNELCAYALVIDTDYLGYVRCYKILERNLHLYNIYLFRFISSNTT